MFRFRSRWDSHHCPFAGPVRNCKECKRNVSYILSLQCIVRASTHPWRHSRISNAINTARKGRYWIVAWKVQSRIDLNICLNCLITVNICLDSIFARKELSSLGRTWFATSGRFNYLGPANWQSTDHVLEACWRRSGQRMGIAYRWSKIEGRWW